MAGIVKTFMDDTPLNGGKVVVVDGHILLATPSKTAVIDDDVLGILDAQACTSDETAILRFGKVSFINNAHTETQVTDNDIVRTAQVHLTATNQDAVARSSLSGYGDILQTGSQFTFLLRIHTQLDDTTHAEHDGRILLASLGGPGCPTPGRTFRRRTRAYARWERSY